jgi:hypothetical protein
LARIHRYTIKRLRREIEPVEPRELMRFLCAWQRVGNERGAGPDALAAVLAQLEGFEAPAEAWESELLTARVVDYEPSWLDDLCLAGRVLWTRQRSYSPTAAGGATGPVRNTPIVLLQRKNLSLWNGLREVQSEPYQPSSRAQRVASALNDHGAMFFDEIADASHLLAAELETALGELVAGNGPLRQLRRPARAADASRQARQTERTPRPRMQPSGLTSAAAGRRCAALPAPMRRRQRPIRKIEQRCASCCAVTACCVFKSAAKPVGCRPAPLARLPAPGRGGELGGGCHRRPVRRTICAASTSSPSCAPCAAAHPAAWAPPVRRRSLEPDGSVARRPHRQHQQQPPALSRRPTDRRTGRRRSPKPDQHDPRRVMARLHAAAGDRSLESEAQSHFAAATIA